MPVRFHTLYAQGQIAQMSPIYQQLQERKMGIRSNECERGECEGTERIGHQTTESYGELLSTTGTGKLEADHTGSD